MDMSKTMDLYQNTHIGFPEESIAKAEKRIGVRLPENYREYLKKYGRDAINTICHYINDTEDIVTTYQIIEQELKEEWQEEFEQAVQSGKQQEYCNNEYFTLWQMPIEKWSEITENYVLVWTENQGVWHAGYLLKDLKAGNTNPPIYISTEDDFITFQKCTDNMEEFLHIMFQQAQGNRTLEEFLTSRYFKKSV